MIRKRPVRLAYLSGPANAEKIYEEWATNWPPASFDVSYLRQYYETCSALDLEGYVITTVPGRNSCRQIGKMLLENCPPPSLKGIRYHLAMCRWFVSILARLIRYRPDALIVTAEQNYWFMLWPLTWMGVRIFPSLHCTLWPKFVPLRTSWKLMLQLNKFFIFRNAAAVMAVSDEIADQVRRLTSNPTLEIAVFRPFFLRDHFRDIVPGPLTARPPFRIGFVGRLEANKGVYTLIDVAEKLEGLERGRYVFDVCGDGSEYARFMRKIEDRGLQDAIRCHGNCDVRKLRAVLGSTHAIIVPTTTEFEEGFNKVCAEAILLGRPVITSAVCPALPVIRAAAVEVPPDDTKAYFRAIVALSTDALMYRERCDACTSLQPQFYDENNRYGAKLTSLLNRFVLSKQVS